MNRGLTVVAGPVRSGKTGRLVACYRRHLAAGPPGDALWLAPNHRTATAVRHELVGRAFPAALDPHCLSFEQFARRVLEASPLVVRPLGALGRRHLLGQLIREALDAGRLEYFAPIARTGGFLDLVVGFVEELKRLEIWPQELRAARGLRASPKDRELWQILRRLSAGPERARSVRSPGDVLVGTRAASRRTARTLRGGAPLGRRRLRRLHAHGARDAANPGRSRRVDDDQPAAWRAMRSAASCLPNRRPRWPSSSGVTRGSPSNTWSAVRAVGRSWTTWSARCFTCRDKSLRRRSRWASRSCRLPESPARWNCLRGASRRCWSMVMRRPAACRCVPATCWSSFARWMTRRRNWWATRFAEYGIPAAIASAPRLARSSVVGALADWLELDLEDWPYRRLLAMLVHNRFRPGWPEWLSGRAAVAAEHVVRRLAVPSGRAALVTSWERLAAQAQRSEAGADARNPARSRNRRCWPCRWCVASARCWTPFPRGPRFRGGFKRRARWPTRRGCCGAAADTDANGGATDTDRLEWEQFAGALIQLARLSAWLGRGDVELSRRDFFEHVQEVMRTVPLPKAGDEAGRVRVLPAESARQASRAVRICRGAFGARFSTGRARGLPLR